MDEKLLKSMKAGDMLLLNLKNIRVWVTIYMY